MRTPLRFQGGITRHLCRRTAEWHRRRFRQLVFSRKLAPGAPREVPFEIVSFSGSPGFEDQVLSILSFMAYAGNPLKWTVYSDKSHSPEEKRRLAELFPFVSVEDWDVYPVYRNNRLIADYLGVCGLAMKLNVLIGHPYRGQTFYVDSDILFYRNISYYLESPAIASGLWYVPDAMEDVPGYFSGEPRPIFALNSGFLILNGEFDPRGIYRYLESRAGRYGYFTEQSAFEYAFAEQGARLLDPRQFIIDTTDQFRFGIKYHPADIAMRHYTSPVRHKIWQNGWQWHLKGLDR